MTLVAEITEFIPGYTTNPEPVYISDQTLILSATRDSDGKLVILKLIRNEHPSSSDIMMLKHEYEILRNFDFEDVIQVYDFEEYKNRYALVLGNVVAPSLAEVLKNRDGLKLEHFLDLAVSITNALRHVHQKSVIHKDINPANILVDKKKVKIIDFGLATTFSKERVEIVHPDFLEGTLAYISPEQTGRMNRGIDYRTDYYSLGVVFYEMLTGRLPFLAVDLMELIYCHIAVTPEEPSKIKPEIPEIVSKIIMKLLSKDVEERYQSTHGLLKDLNSCIFSFKETGTIAPFPLASEDLSSRFIIPEKLYGRALECEQLIEVYEKVLKGNTEFLLVSGYSGVGKSSLVRETQKLLASKNTYFISGKFDQFQRNIPYFAFTQAFNDLVDQILKEPKGKIELLRKKIMNAVGENGQILLEIIPKIHLIIGDQPQISEGLTESATQNGFSYILQNLITKFSERENPLVLFLDDLQWADFSSLKIIESVLKNQDCQYLFLIGSYRNNEVDAGHPLMILLDELKNKSIPFELIELSNLRINDVQQLLSETLHQDDQSALKNLADILYEKTGGNPFYIEQLLMKLYRENVITRDEQKNYWTYRIEDVVKQSMSHNMAEVMIQKIRSLPLPTQKALSLAACIGNQFDLELLPVIYDRTTEETLFDLQAALEENYIFQIEKKSALTPVFQFSHDQIRQASNSIIEDKTSSQIHMRIARLLHKKYTNSKVEKLNFSIVEHYNLGIDYDSFAHFDEKDRKTIADLNLRACKQARLSAAYGPAQKYVEYGLKWMLSTTWSEHYDLLLALYKEGTLVSFLNGKFDLLDQYRDEALKHTKSLADEFIFHQIKLIALDAKLQDTEMLDLAQHLMERVNFRFHRNPGTISLINATLKLKFSLLGKKYRIYL